MIKERLASMLQSIAREQGFSYPEGVIIEEPPASISADLSTNVALQLAKISKQNPRKLAEEFQAKLRELEGIKEVEIAGPGFLNLHLSKEWFLQALQNEGSLKSKPEKIIVEYVSANPTGPLHIGNARGGPIGEAIARVLEKVGHQVSREFYVNDIGNQASLFAASVLHYYRLHFGQESIFPEKGYPAEYVKELAEEIAQQEGDRLLSIPLNEQNEVIRGLAIKLMVQKIKATCDRMQIQFDDWFWQNQLPASGLSAETFHRLEEKGATLKKDGAIWLKAGLTEDDRETVLRKSSGEGTYFLDDLAYHLDKFEKRQFDRAIVLLGANHSGHIPRMQAGIKALGIDPERYQGVLYQYVQVKEGKKTRKMAKRLGSFITADEVLDEVPVEVFTYFMVSKSNATHLDFDLQLAKDTSEKNPIYYIQYAHARVHSLLRLGQEKKVEPNLLENEEYSQYERRLIFWLDQYLAVVEEVASTFHPHLLASYLYELATRFHHLYAHQRIITDDQATSQKLLFLSKKTGSVLQEGLALLNIKAKEQM